MVGALTTAGGLAAVCLVLALAFHRWNVGKAKKAVPWLMLVAGLGMVGLIGSVISAVIGTGFDLVGSVTGVVFGIGLPVVLVIIMTIKFLSDIRGGGGTSKSGMVNAFLLFPALSVPFAGFASWAESMMGQAGSTAAEFLSQLG